MKKSTKIALVLVGYAIAFLGACLATAVYHFLSSLPEVQASSGMAAFGELVFFLGTWAFLSLFPTLLGLFFLRRNPVFWSFFAWACLGLAVAADLAEAMDTCIRLLRWSGGPWDFIGLFGLACLGAAPFLALFFLLSGWFSPDQRSRWIFWIAAGLEALAFTYAMANLFFFHRFA